MLPSRSSNRSILVEAEERFGRFLASEGLRLTRERRRLLELLLRGDRRIDADDLVHRARQSGTPISRATVYRTMELMVKCGLVRHTGASEKTGGFEHVLGASPTVRLVCLSCGGLSVVASEDIRRRRDELCRRHGFRPQHHHLEVFGRCRNCCATEKDGTRRRRVGRRAR